MRTKRVTTPEEIAEDFARLVREYPKAAATVLTEVVDLDIGPDTINEVPVETGALSRSWTGAVFLEGGFVLGATHVGVVGDGVVSIEFGYGMHYAFWVHEIPPGDLAMPGGGFAVDVLAGVGRTATHRPPMKWKFLEDPVNRHVGSVPRRLVEHMDKIMGGG